MMYHRILMVSAAALLLSAASCSKQPPPSEPGPVEAPTASPAASPTPTAETPPAADEPTTPAASPSAAPKPEPPKLYEPKLPARYRITVREGGAEVGEVVFDAEHQATFHAKTPGPAAKVYEQELNKLLAQDEVTVKWETRTPDGGFHMFGTPYKKGDPAYPTAVLNALSHGYDADTSQGFHYLFKLISEGP